LPRYAADRVLLAPLDDVWTFVAEPFNLPDWFPGVSGVQPDRRGMAPGARWQVLGSDRPSLLKKPDAAGMLLVLDVVPGRRIAFQLTGQRLDAELGLEPVGEGTRATLAVDAPFLTVSRSFPSKALQKLFELCQTGVER
jgi:carbon monoxide dehydrogenase subunit G